MGKIAGIKGKSPDVYPPDNSGQPTIATESLTTLPVNVFSDASPPVSTSILPTALLAGGNEDRVIVMYSGQLQWPYDLVDGSPSPAFATITVGIYLDGSSTPAYSIVAFVPVSNIHPATPPQPVPFSLFWETPSDGEHIVDVRATGTTGVGAWSVSGSLILISTPV